MKAVVSETIDEHDNYFLLWQRLDGECGYGPHRQNLKIRRCYLRRAGTPVDIQLHIFTDASQLGFGAVAYLRIVFPDGGVEVAFLMVKTHAAPLKQRTIPQLELKGAHARVGLAKLITTELDVDK